MKEKKVFVIYGRNIQARNQLYNLLRLIGLYPIEWDDAVSLTNKSSPFIGEVIEAAFSQVQALIILFTGDEITKLLNIYSKGEEKNYSLQCRPNVLFEAGYAFGINPSHTILVQIGVHRKISDLEGRYVVHLNNTYEKKRELVNRIKTAGCKLDRKWSYKLQNDKDLDFEINVLEDINYLSYGTGIHKFYSNRQEGMNFSTMINLSKNNIIMLGVKFGNIIQQTELLYEKIIYNKKFTATILFLSPLFPDGNIISWLGEVEKFNGFKHLYDGLILTIKNFKALKKRLKERGASYNKRLIIKGYYTLPTGSLVFYDKNDCFAMMKMEPFNFKVLKDKRLSIDIRKEDQPEVFDTYLKSVESLIKVSIDINDPIYDCYNNN